jgi:hypothetical protein
MMHRLFVAAAAIVLASAAGASCGGNGKAQVCADRPPSFDNWEGG